MNANPSGSPSPSFIRASLAAVMGLFVGGCASVTKAPSTPPAATVRIQQVSAAYYGSATKGQGTLHFQGERRSFTLSSIGVGGTGGLKISATGKVYGLSHISQFPETYRGVSRGLTLIEGKMHAKLTNPNGVVIYLTGQTEGIASSTGVQTYQISFGQ